MEQENQESLDVTQIAQEIENEGFCYLPKFFDISMINSIKQSLMEEIDKRAENLLQLGKIQNKFENERFEIRYGLLVNQAREMAFKFNVPYILSQPMLDIAHFDKLQDILKVLIGPEVGVSPIMHLRAKPPVKYGLHNFSHGTPLHQDHITLDDASLETKLITVWFALTDQDESMGILEVFGGNKEKKFFKHSTKNVQKGQTASICPKDDEFIRANLSHFKPINISAGDAIIMNQYTPHRSDPNNSDNCRFTMDIRFYNSNQANGRTKLPGLCVNSVDSSKIISVVDGWKQDWLERVKDFLFDDLIKNKNNFC